MKNLIPVLALILTALAASLVACSKSTSAGAKPRPDPAVPVTVVEVEVVPLDRVAPVVGPLCPKDEAAVSAEVEGRVERILVDMGDVLAPGDGMALIDTSSYQAQLELSAANLAKAQANLTHAEQNLRRIQELCAVNISAASDFDLATAQAGQARADVKAQEAALAIARINLNRSHVKAPFAGSVAARLVSAGDYVKTGTPLYRVVNDIELKLTMPVNEGYAGEVKPGQTVRFSVDAYPNQVFEGRVFLISPAVNTANSTFPVSALVTNATRLLKANTFARGELVLARSVPTAVVPLGALVSFAGVTKAFVIENNVARLRNVKTGRVKAGRQEILAGLKAGEAVAVTGNTKLYEGARVRLLQGARPDSGTPANLKSQI
jgi:membrane fusion protein (multidrug efflux system)